MTPPDYLLSDWLECRNGCDVIDFERLGRCWALAIQTDIRLIVLSISA